MNTKKTLIASAALLALAASASALTSAPVRAAGPARAAAPVEAPAAPTQVAAVAGDHNAILSWNGFPEEDAGSADVTGYRVTYGRAGGPATAQVLTTRATAQLQPLDNTATYEARVEALTGDGRLSSPSQPLRFSGNPARVNALRARMNGFFDDFTRPSGFPDALKWNVAVSACNAPIHDGFFVNAQFHVHNELASGKDCVKGQSVSRPRAVFDFEGRTGTIAFDLDGAQRSDQWYLDLVPNLADITGQTGVEDGLNKVGDRGKERLAPGTMLRLHQSNQDIEIIWIDGQGYEHMLARGDAEKAGVPLVPNVRHPFEVHVNRHHADVTIDGKTIVATDALDLPFSHAHLLWNAFSYDTLGNSNEAAFLLHWGNFGFDAPAGAAAPVVHDYTAGILRGGAQPLVDSATTLRPSVPDAIDGLAAARLMLTLQASPDGGYEWSAGDHVSVNGTALAIPAPGGAGLTPEQVVTDESPYSVVLPVPPDAVVAGDNVVEVALHQAMFLNLHLELEFPPGYAGSYTRPPGIAGWAPATATPLAPSVGPGVTIDSVGKTQVADILKGTTEEVAKRRPLVVAGRPEVRASFQDEAALNGTGKMPGVRAVELLVDGRVVDTRRVDLQVAAVAGSLGFRLDTTRMRDGLHMIEVRATGADGVASIPDYEAAATHSGDSRPLRVEVRNHPSIWRWFMGLWRRQAA